MVHAGEEWHDDANALHRQGEVIAQKPRQGADAGGQAQGLELAAPVVFKGSLQHARHFKRRRRHARDGQQRGGINFDDLLHAVGDDDIAGGGAAVAGHEHAPGVMKGKNGGGLGLHGRARRGSGRRGRETALGQKRKEVACNRERLAHWPVRWR